MDENIAKFTEKMNELLEIAKKEKNVLMQDEINNHFKDMDLSADKINSIYEFLEGNGVEVLRMTDDTDAADDLLLDIERDDEEEEIENIDFSDKLQPETEKINTENNSTIDLDTHDTTSSEAVTFFSSLLNNSNDIKSDLFDCYGKNDLLVIDIGEGKVVINKDIIKKYLI